MAVKVSEKVQQMTRLQAKLEAETITLDELKQYREMLDAASKAIYSAKQKCNNVAKRVEKRELEAKAAAIGSSVVDRFGKNVDVQDLVTRAELEELRAKYEALLAKEGQSEEATTATPQTETQPESDVTDAPATRPAPAEASVATTETVTDAPTDEPTEAVTDAATAAPTDAVTDAVIGAATAAPTDVVTDAETDAVIDAATEAVIGAVTAAPTDVVRDAVTDVRGELGKESFIDSDSGSDIESGIPDYILELENTVL